MASTPDVRSFAITIAGVIIGGVLLAAIKRRSPFVRKLIGE